MSSGRFQGMLQVTQILPDICFFKLAGAAQHAVKGLQDRRLL